MNPFLPTTYPENASQTPPNGFFFRQTITNEYYMITGTGIYLPKQVNHEHLLERIRHLPKELRFYLWKDFFEIDYYLGIFETMLLYNKEIRPVNIVNLSCFLPLLLAKPRILKFFQRIYEKPAGQDGYSLFDFFYPVYKEHRQKIRKQCKYMPVGKSLATALLLHYNNRQEICFEFHVLGYCKQWDLCRLSHKFMCLECGFRHKKYSDDIDQDCPFV